MTFAQGFPADRESYRSRARAKKRKEQEESDRLSKLESMVSHLHQQVDEMREHGATHQLQEGAPTGGPSQLRSSVASTRVGADEPSKETYPMDYITEKTSCELHVGVRNLSFKVADGYALTCESTARWHCNAIPDGYGRVGVDQVLPGYESMELEIPGADDERTLGDVGGGIILWRKKYIVLPGSAPRTPSSPPSRHSPPPSPHDDERDDHHSTSPSRSPPPHHPTPQPPPLTKAQSQKRKRTLSFSMANRHGPRQEPLPKVPPAPPVRAYDRTVEENAVIVDAEVKRQFAPKKPEAKQKI